MQPQHQMRKRAVAEPIVPERILALPQNMKPVWVTCTVLLGWRIGMHGVNFEFYFCLDARKSVLNCHTHHSVVFATHLI